MKTKKSPLETSIATYFFFYVRECERVHSYLFGMHAYVCKPKIFSALEKWGNAVWDDCLSSKHSSHRPPLQSPCKGQRSTLLCQTKTKPSPYFRLKRGDMLCTVTPINSTHTHQQSGWYFGSSDGMMPIKTSDDLFATNRDPLILWYQSRSQLSLTFSPLCECHEKAAMIWAQTYLLKGFFFGSLSATRFPQGEKMGRKKRRWWVWQQNDFLI